MRGSHLEAMVRASADRQKDQGLWLIQTGPRFVGKVTGPAGEATGRVVAPGGLDFIGDLRGQAVTFDAKSSTVTTSFGLDLLKPHQVVIVKNAHARGTIAFFLVELGAGTATPAYFALTWPVLQRYWQPYYHGAGDDTPGSIPRRVIEAECLRVDHRGCRLDLVSAVRALASIVEERNNGA